MPKIMETVASITLMKSLLILFNTVFWFTGVALLVLGIWMLVELHKYMEISAEFSETAPYVFLGTGAAVVLVGLCACCCTLTGNTILLYLYGTFLLVVFVIEISAGISGYAFRGNLRDSFYKGLNQSLYDYTQDPETASAVDMLQSSVHCCGVDSYIDWYKTPFSHGQTIVPKSCCVNPSKCDVLDINDLNQMGCFDMVMSFLNSNIAWIAGIAIVIASFQIFGVVLTCCLARNVHKANYDQLQ